ncbi:protein of unknown function DUF2215 [Echinococcus multilocularis]|uniref:Transmembrane protein 194A n=1 Tax=Echinococcus multilocularis TaxID=6211 RepID=A0A068YIW7_ECHMU|nr:protein of unknown function DUF2215 [Echinococcus multilocularis]
MRLLQMDVGILILTSIVLPFVNCDDFSPTYLSYGSRERLILTGLGPSVVCLRGPPWFEWVFSAFQRHTIKIDATSPEVYPFYAFTAVNELDLRSRSPWLHDFPSPSLLSSFFSLFPAPSPGYFELREDASIELFGFDSHCVAFISQPGKTYYGRQIGIDVEFEARTDWFRISRLLCGFALYFIAPVLSSNLAFYYFTGMSLSVIGSILIILLVAMRLLPKRATLLFQGALLIGGGAFSFFFIYLDYLRSLLWGFVLNNVGWVLCYVLGTALISCAILYWFGLPEQLIRNFPRTRTLLQVLIRTAAVLLIASAPHLPSQLPILTDIIHLTAQYSKVWFNINPHLLLAVSPLVMRAVFAGAALAMVSYISKTHPKGKRRRPPRDPLWENYQVLPAPCASSSPYNKQSRKPVWHPPGSGFHGTLSTSNYGGYVYLAEEDDEYETGYTEAYWDGNGYVFSPVPRVGSNRSTSRRWQTASSRSPKSRSKVGWVVMQDAVLTDDEENG